MEFTGERMVPGFNKGDEIYLEHLNRYFFASRFVEGKRVLDIASGTGYGSSILHANKAKNVIGVDISEEAISFSKKTYKADDLNFLVGSATSIPVEDNSIDIVVSFETLEHLSGEDQTKFLKEIDRVLTHDGVLIMSTPNVNVFPKGNSFHIKELNRKEFTDLLDKYFGQVKILYQDNIEVGYISSKKMLEAGLVPKNGLDYSSIAESVNPEKSMYYMAVCSRGGSSDFLDETSTFLFSDIKPTLLGYKAESLGIENQDLKDRLRESKRKEAELNEAVKIIGAESEARNRELLAIKNSRVWRLRNYLSKIMGRKVV